MKDLRACVGKLGKALEFSFDGTFAASQGPEWEVAVDEKLICDAVACHYYREGRADLADAVRLANAKKETALAETRSAESETARGNNPVVRVSRTSSYEASDAEVERASRFARSAACASYLEVLSGIERRDVRPVLRWIEKNASAATRASSAGRSVPAVSSLNRPTSRGAMGFPLDAKDARAGEPFIPDATSILKTRAEPDARLGFGRARAGWFRDAGVDLEFAARVAEFGELLSSGDAGEACRRVRESVGFFRERARFETLERFFGNVAFESKPSDDGFGGDWRQTVTDAFETAFFVSRFESSKSPLLVTANAGCLAMPALVKLSKTGSRNRAVPKPPRDRRDALRDENFFRALFSEPSERADLSAGRLGASAKINALEKLPAEIFLPASYQFGSVFVCPVERDAVFDPEDHLMMLPCGVVVSEKSIEALAPSRPRSHRQTFKCVHCSSETKREECTRIRV